QVVAASLPESAAIDRKTRSRILARSVNPRNPSAAEGLALIGRVGDEESLIDLRMYASHRFRRPLRPQMLMAMQEIEDRLAAETEAAQLLRSSEANERDSLLRAPQVEEHVDQLLRAEE